MLYVYILQPASLVLLHCYLVYILRPAMPCPCLLLPPSYTAPPLLPFASCASFSYLPVPAHAPAVPYHSIFTSGWGRAHLLSLCSLFILFLFFVSALLVPLLVLLVLWFMVSFVRLCCMLHAFWAFFRQVTIVLAVLLLCISFHSSMCLSHFGDIILSDVLCNQWCVAACLHCLAAFIYSDATHIHCCFRMNLK